MINRLIDTHDLDHHKEQELFAHLRSKSMPFGYVRKYKTFRIDFKDSVISPLLTDSNYLLYGRPYSFLASYNSRKDALLARNRVYRKFFIFEIMSNAYDFDTLESPLKTMDLINTIDALTNNLETVADTTAESFFSTLVSKYDVNRYDYDITMEIKALCLLNINTLFEKWKGL